MVNTGFDRDGAENVIGRGDADLVSFGVPFIANPDLVERMQGDVVRNPTHLTAIPMTLDGDSYDI